MLIRQPTFSTCPILRCTDRGMDSRARRAGATSRNSLAILIVRSTCPIARKAIRRAAAIALCGALGGGCSPGEHASGRPEEPNTAQVNPARVVADGAESMRTPLQLRRAELDDFVPRIEVRRVADWALRTHDNRGLPFIIIDKASASVFMFEAAGRLQAAAPALLGLGRGDRFGPGSAEKNMYETRPEERITPAGRFVAERGTGDKGEDVVWIDYDAGIALHAVLDVPGQRRHERISSETAEDNRISFGCVNVPREFYFHVVRPAFEKSSAIVYVLPESQPALHFFSTSSSSAGRRRPPR